MHKHHWNRIKYQCLTAVILPLQGKLLKKAASMLVAEKEQNKRERESALNERVPPLKLSGLSAQELQELCKELHRKIDIVDEAKYDMEIKMSKNETEIQTLTQKINEIKGSMNRSKLKRVKKSADAMLGALTESKLSSKADFKANLKTVKKEDEKKEEVTDWRKNTKILKKASSLLVTEKEEKLRERERVLSERVPPLQLSGLSLQELQALCKDLHQKIDQVDEERYDTDIKVNKNDKEIAELSHKIIELKGKMKRPALKRVKISADAMLGALLGAKVKESVDFKANLKTVKKEEEKKEEVTDWRKNVEAMSGMEGRKKLFDAAQ
ncbi:Troponin I, slow skeletal muscle [Bagarius yarrelli]|uniref:Troponin I, slow skeletal muscle n=1 Tax=Bagarius yarrelli TaxID=175774 RepID=A0A556TNE4_BAGYA|nr:Troponin I, slow skeletal muscle [Bagarius yarrelli]